MKVFSQNFQLKPLKKIFRRFAPFFWFPTGGVRDHPPACRDWGPGPSPGGALAPVARENVQRQREKEKEDREVERNRRRLALKKMSFNQREGRKRDLGRPAPPPDAGVRCRQLQPFFLSLVSPGVMFV